MVSATNGGDFNVDDGQVLATNGLLHPALAGTLVDL
jgi:hypothetical protein